MNNRLAELYRKLRFLIARDQFGRDLDEEMRLQIELRAQQHTEAFAPARKVLSIDPMEALRYE